MKAATLLLLSLLVGGQVPQSPPSGQDRLASIYGIVTRIGTAEPLPGASLRLIRASSGTARPQPINATTDSGGRFRFEELEPGNYTFVVFRNGFVRQEYGQSQPGRTGSVLELAEGQEQEVLFQLVPAGTIAGRIYDENGEPVPGAAVQALTRRYTPDGLRTLTMIQAVMTNDRGEYRLFWLNPGSYYISAGFGGSMIAAILGSRNLAPAPGGIGTVFYPGVPDPGHAVAVGLSAGDELAGIDLALVGNETVSVRGRLITMIPGLSPSAATVEIRPGSASTGLIEARMPVARPDAQGNFELPAIPPGSYRLSARLRTGTESYRTTMSLQVPERDLDNVVLTIGPGVDLPGRLYREQVEEPEIPTDADASDRAGLRVLLMPVDSAAATPNAITESDGRFVMEDVASGRYLVRVDRVSDDYLKRVRFAGYELPDQMIDVAGAPEGSLDLLLSARAGRIEGVATGDDGEVRLGTTVVLIPEGNTPGKAWFYKTSSIDQNGNFTLRGITPGEYLLLAWESLEQYEYYNPDLVRRFESRAERVVIEEGSQLNLSLRIITAEEAP